MVLQQTGRFEQEKQADPKTVQTKKLDGLSTYEDGSPKAKEFGSDQENEMRETSYFKKNSEVEEKGGITMSDLINQGPKKLVIPSEGNKFKLSSK